MRALAAATLLSLLACIPAAWGRDPAATSVRAPGVAGAPGTYHLDLTLNPQVAKAGEPVEMVFQAIDPTGKPIRFLEMIHERPLHLLVVSEDLAEFDHVHPEQVVGTSYNLSHVFAHGGRYRLYAAYTPPGSGALVDQFIVKIEGPQRRAERLIPDPELTKVADGVKVELKFERPLSAGADIPLTCSFSDATTGQPVDNLQLYLGSLAHLVLIHQDLGSFVHIHPFDAGEVYDPSKDPSAHFHDPKELAKRLVGPSPSEIQAVAGFPRPGTYKLWIQFRRADRETIVPFVLRVGADKTVARRDRKPIPQGAIQIKVSASGYEPARIDVQKGQPVRLAFLRPDANNCGGTVVFPSLNRRYALPVGETVVVEILPAESGEIVFTCGMGMFKGLLVVTEPGS